MSDKEILSQKLDQILRGMVKYSFTLGGWGKYVWVVIYLGYNGYNSGSFGVKRSEMRRFGSQTVSRSRREDIYRSKYNYTTDSYNINFNLDTRELRKNMREVKNIIRNIEILAIDIYNIVVNSYLDPSEEYKKISIYFRRDVPNYNKIIKEIKESTIFGQSIPKKYEFYEFIDQYYNKIIEEIKKSKKSTIFGQSIPKKYEFISLPVFMFTALKEKKEDINDDKIDLSYPNYYRFSFTVYELSKFSLNLF